MELLTTEQAARFLNRPTGTLVRWRFENAGPPFIRMGRGICYRREDLESYIMTNRVEPETMGAPS